MYLVIEVDSSIVKIVFDWEFRYEIVFNIRDFDVWHVILYVYDKEWIEIEMPGEDDFPEEVIWFCLCIDQEFDEWI